MERSRNDGRATALIDGVMMTVLRLLYLVCWRNRLLIPLIISCVTFAMVVTMFYHGSSEEPNIARQTILSQRHKLRPRDPQVNMHHHHHDHRVGSEKGGNRHSEHDSLRAIPDAPKNRERPGKGKNVKLNALGPNVPDHDELVDKLAKRLKENRKKDKKEEEPQKLPTNNKGNVHVINPEHGKVETGKDKWHRNPANVEKNMIFVQHKEVEPLEKPRPAAEKKVNSLLLEGNRKSNDFFKVAEEEPSDDTARVKHSDNQRLKHEGHFKSDNDKPVFKVVDRVKVVQQLDIAVNQRKISNQGRFSVRELSEKLAMNGSDVGLAQDLNSMNGSVKVNGTVYNLKPIVFKAGMPISPHKHKRKVVNYDIKPYRKPRKYNPHHSKDLYRNSSSYLPDHLSDWLHDEEQFCDNRMKAYHGEFAVLKNVILDTSFAEGNKGGESIQSVINQPEEDEYYQYMYGFFQLPCTKKPDYFFNNNNHINQWLFSTRTTNLDATAPVDAVDTKFTIAVVRYEYVNIYHSMTDFYNAFILMEFFNKTQTETNILVIDGHPKGSLDGVWDVLFNSSQRISQLPKRTQYTNLIWGMLGYNSPIMDHYAFKLPLVNEFRRFFLSSYRVNDLHKLSCDHLTITFIWRRDYVAHPRNPSGTVSRKIANEEELVQALHNKYPNYTIQGMQIDLFDMRDQLQTIAHTDILIGMHGAGLTHALFLPSHAGLVELLPVYWAAANEHFEAIARWRQLLYQRWVNVDSKYEIRDHVTKVPPDVLTGMVNSIISDMCGRVAQRVYPGFISDTG